MSLSEYRYFPGTRVDGPYIFEEASSTIQCQVVSMWRNIENGATARCGVNTNFQLAYECGVEASETAKFSSSLEGTVGIEKIASLKGKIEEARGVELKWNQITTTTRSYEIPAPKCGAQTWVFFQLVRDYRFTVVTERMFRKPKITTPRFTERTQFLDYSIDDDPFDPACPCSTGGNYKDGEIITLAIGNLGLRVDAYPTADERYTFRIGPQSYSVDPREAVAGSATVKLDNPPAIIRDFSGVEDVEFDVKVRILPEFTTFDFLTSEGSVVVSEPEVIVPPVETKFQEE